MRLKHWLVAIALAAALWVVGSGIAPAASGEGTYCPFVIDTRYVLPANEGIFVPFVIDTRYVLPANEGIFVPFVVDTRNYCGARTWMLYE